jgi:hypothetical protein
MLIIFANVSSVFLFLAGVMVFIYVWMRKSHLEQEQRRASTIISNRSPQIARAPSTASKSNIDLEIADVSRDINGQLTTKMIVIEQLIADSQKQIERMEELLDRIEAAKQER